MKNLVKYGVVMCVALIFAGCKPYDKPEFKEIAPNETAFLIALEGDAKVNQAKFQSEQYLNDVKVPTKRVQIPHREVSIGRAYWNVEYKPTVVLITVDRAPQSRAWTLPGSGTNSSSNQVISVESQDSVGFGVGVSCIAAIEEADTAKFLYNYSGRKLADIMDSDVRNWVQSYASNKFGDLPLNECQKQKGAIFSACEKEAKEYWKQYGITIRKMGYAEGMTYENKEIQTQIDNAFNAELKKKVEEQARQAQTVINQKELEIVKNDNAKQLIINQKELSVAENKRKMAEEFAKAADAQTKLIELEVKKMNAQALLTAAEKWGGTVPSTFLGGVGNGSAQMPLVIPIQPK